jgi:thiol-disulfide isomerase/thioredoxin
MAIPRYPRMRLSAAPKGARPIDAYLAGTKDDPASITLPVLPAIRGRVLDPQGSPVPNTAVGWHLNFLADGSGEMLPSFGGALAVTDREGSFEIAPMLELHFYMSRPAPESEALCFADPSFRSESYQLLEPNRTIRMAFEVFDTIRPDQPMKVTLKPSRRVRIPIDPGFVTSNRETQFDSQIWVTPRKEMSKSRLFLITRDLGAKKGSRTQAGETVLEEDLPEGTYQLEVNLRDAKTSESLAEARREIIVPRGDGPLDLAPLALEPADFLKIVGKAASEIDATDLDTGRPVKLADFRGKVVVLDFWGYWCGPCLANMPYLTALKRKFEGRPLEILAVHDQSVQSRAVYDRKIAAARQRIWGGRDLPFRVLLDRPDPKKPDDLNPEGTGTTVLRYGITGFPTLFVIDRDGTMIGQVGVSHHDRLESLVRELLEKAESVR